MEILDRELIQLFPTCLFAGKVSDITNCDRIEKTVRAMQKAGIGRDAVDKGRAITNEDRIVVAFNIMIRGTINNPTAHLELK
jgi:hypothetical protein